MPAKNKKRKNQAAPIAAALLPAALFCALAQVLCKTRGAAFNLVFWLTAAALVASGCVLLRASAGRPRYMRAKTSASLIMFSLVFSLVEAALGAVFIIIKDVSVVVAAAVLGAPLLIFLLISGAVLSASRKEAPPAKPAAREGGAMPAIEREVVEIAARCENSRSREMILSVSDALLFSDPLSNFDTASCEDAIARYVYQLDALTDLGDAATVESVCDAIHIQIERRNEICVQSRSAGESL